MADDRRQLSPQIAELLHAALCDCLDNGTGFTFRSADGQKAANALLPLLDRVAADAAAEALEEFADEQDSSTNHQCDAPYWARDLAERSRARAAKLRAPARTDEEN